jgi:ABC-type branched-subunit amino acid transport system substrate-binding protein
VGSEDFALQLERVKAARPDVIVHWGDAHESALILNQLRSMGVTVPYLASDRTVADEFVKLAGKNAEGVIAAYPWDPSRKDPKLDAFRAAFRKRFNDEAETYAAHAYDGMNMLIDAVQNAGLNRAQIRDVLAYRNDPWPGVTHDIPMGAALDDLGEVYLAKFENGKWNYDSRESLGIPRGTIPRRDRLTRGGEEKTTSAVPYRDSRQEVRQYNGPDTEVLEKVDAVKIGFFGPHDPATPDSSLWLGAQLAVEETNRAGGYRGTPFRLIPWWSDSPWKAGAPAVAKMAYDDKVLAVIGSVDGASTHLAETVVAKAQLPLIDPGSTDKSVNYAGIPWMFSVAPSDEAQAAAIREALLREAASGYVLVSATDHDSRALVASLKLTPKQHWEIQPGGPTAGAAGQAAASGLPAVVIAASADSGRFVRDLRAGGSNALVFGGPTFGRREFLAAAGPAAGPVRYPGMLQTSATASGFAARFRARYGFSPDYPAYYGYDAAAMTVASVKQAGLTRSGIRNALRQAEVWDGVSGLIEWNPAGRNSRAVTLISEGLNK